MTTLPTSAKEVRSDVYSDLEELLAIMEEIRDVLLDLIVEHMDTRDSDTEYEGV